MRAIDHDMTGGGEGKQGRWKDCDVIKWDIKVAAILDLPTKLLKLAISFSFFHRVRWKSTSMLASIEEKWNPKYTINSRLISTWYKDFYFLSSLFSFLSKERDWSYDLVFSGRPADFVYLPRITDLQDVTACWWLKTKTTSSWSEVFSLDQYPDQVVLSFSFRGSATYAFQVHNYTM